MSLRAGYVPSRELPQPVTFTLVRWTAKPATLLAFLALLLWALTLQRDMQASVAGFGGAADEGAHFVTALMIRDYVAQGLHGSPLAYAERYYLHYPKVAFGIWPPLFHFVAAGWLLVFGPSTLSALTFIAATAAFFALCVFIVGRKLFDTPTGLIAAAWLLALPSVQTSTSMFMMDLLCAALMFGAAVTFGAYLDTDEPRYSYAFGLLASAAIMTKYNALALALLPPFAAVAARRPSLMRRPSFWAPLFMVTALCGWWYVLQSDLVWYASQPYSTIADVPRMMKTNTATLAFAAGALALPLIVLGSVTTMRAVATARHAGLWSSLFALAVSVWVFHSIFYPAIEERYLLPAFTSLILFLCAGVDAIIRSRQWRIHSAWRAAALLAVLIPALLMTHADRVKEDRGLDGLAERLVETGRLNASSPVLIASDAKGEGAFIAAVAQRDRRPNAIVIRASKFLATSTWMSAEYRLTHASSSDVLSALDAARVQYVVIDTSSAAPMPHDRQLDLVMMSAQGWEPAMLGGERHRAAVKLYARKVPLAPGAPKIEMNMEHSLGRRLVF